jgi:hypothetical protein
MSSALNVLSGFIQLTGPILQQDANQIINKSYPLSISFSPRSTPPTLQGNKIIDATDITTNTCIYKGNTYTMRDVQICSVMNKGYILPGQSGEPVAELIISYSPNETSNSLNNLSGILLCVPIYDSGVPNHNEYLTRLIDPDMPLCNYTKKGGTEYKEGEYKNIPNSTLLGCVKSCCGDANCVAYTFNSGKCSLKNTTPVLTTTPDESITSGIIDRNGTAKNTDGTVASTALVPTLESIFYGWDGDTTQTSLAYKTTFETVDNNNNMSFRALYVVVFPTGIRLAPAMYQQLLLQMRSSDNSIGNILPPYHVPLIIRNLQNTVTKYRYDSSGNKIVTGTSDKGVIYATQLSSCTDEFRNRFEWFIKPPYRTGKSKSQSFNSEKCPYYKTTEYKCVPFNQLHDLSGSNQDAYVIPGNTTLQNILDNQSSTKLNANLESAFNQISTEDIIEYSAIAASTIVILFVVYKVGDYISTKL